MMNPTKSLIYMYKYLSTVYKGYQVSWDLVKGKDPCFALHFQLPFDLAKKKKKGSTILKIILYPTFVILANLYLNFTT